MSNDKKTQAEDLKKLEDEAYFELCQIIAEAMQYQDVELLNSRISAWKNKYKKLLSDSPSNSNFKKRIEFLLTQYYSAVTKYILDQLNLKEQKMVENQAKALKELYTIIRDTNDYDMLKKKVDKWKEKYPVSGFLRMYQKRIELYTRDKNLKENAFTQEEAFNDLVDITKIHGTVDELKKELSLWEEKYSINDKYSIDDFLKHQSEVKRYTSDEFLQSIAREEFKPDNIEKTNQSKAYTTLIKIINSSNNINEMFKWVYENRNTKFDDKYKELILNATYLQYSPTYLKKFKKPIVDMSKTSLSFDEYKNMSKIKEYAIISYFNLLLPPGQAISNSNFNNNIQTIYTKLEKARVSKHLEDKTLTINYNIPSEKDNTENIASYVKEIKVEIADPKLDSSTNLSDAIEDISETEAIKDILDTESMEEKDSKIEEPINLETISTISIPDDKPEELKIEVLETEDLKDINQDETVEIVTNAEDIDEPEIVLDLSNSKSELTIDLKNPSDSDISTEIKSIKNETPNDTKIIEDLDDKNKSTEEPLNYETIVAVSPLFIEAIDNYEKQSVIVNHINATTTKYIESQKEQTISLDETLRIKNDEN